MNLHKRIDALARAFERRRLEQAAPIDPLSASLWEFGAQLAALDNLGAIAEAAELGINSEDVRKLAYSLTPPIYH